MALRATTATRFKFGPTICRFIPNNPDGGVTGPTRVVSATHGPFDFSAAVVPAAVTVNIKLDNGTVINETLDLSGVGSLAAVTVAELATAWTAASVTGYTGTAESVTGFFKIAKTVPGTARYLQISGEVALYTGMTATIIPVDTQKSIAIDQVNHDSERIETIDSNGKVTAVITDSYPTGATLTVTDSAYDQNLRALVEGGTLVTVSGFTAKQYKSPGPASVPPVITIETFNRLYVRDDQQETNISGYVWRRYQSCKGVASGEPGDRNFQDGVYTLGAVPYRDPVTGTKDLFVYTEQILSTAEYATLDVSNV